MTIRNVPTHRAAMGLWANCLACCAAIGLGSVAAGQESLAPPPDAPCDDRPGAAVVVERAAAGVAGYAVVTHQGTRVARAAEGVARTHELGKLPVYGEGIQKLGFIGQAAAKTRVPLALKEAPYIGKPIYNIPVVGSTIAGTPSPLLTSYVAAENFYYAPKYSPCGYTEAGFFTQTDFNSPPRLRQYVNYLAPLPYTHPPIYEPGPLGPMANSKLPQQESVQIQAVTFQPGTNVDVSY